VLLPDAPEDLELPWFLTAFTCVDLRAGLTREGIDRLVWGITGEEPKPPPPEPTLPTEPAPRSEESLDDLAARVLAGYQKRVQEDWNARWSRVVDE
jgi:hypothetical protein